MARSMGAADNRHATVRPVFARVIRPASDSTSRCFMMAGSDTGNGRASSLTETEFMRAEPRQQRPPRRIGQRREGAIQRLLLDT